MSKTVEQTVEQTTNQNVNAQEPEFTPVFEEIEEISTEGAMNILIQAAGQAQASGALTVRDSVLLAKAISVLRPGSI